MRNIHLTTTKFYPMEMGQMKNLVLQAMVRNNAEDDLVRIVNVTMGEVLEYNGMREFIAGVIGEVALNNVHCWFSLLPGTAVGAGWVVGGVGADAAAVIFVVAVLYQAQKTGLAPGESVERRHQRIRDAALLPVNPNHGHGESCYCDKQKGNDDLAVL